MKPHIDERPTLFDAGLDFRGYGYFTRSLKPNIYNESSASVANHWLELETLIGHLKEGRFNFLPTLLACLRVSNDWRFKDVAARLLGFTGSVEILRDMRCELEELPGRRSETVDVQTREIIKLYCSAFALWGRLDVVPVLMDHYLHLRIRKTPEIGILPILIASLLTDDRSSMLAHEPDESDLDDYLNLVMNRYDEICNQLGSEKALVFRGSLQSVRTWANRMRHITVPTPFLSSEFEKLRSRFESATGTDCSAIFQQGRPSALSAASIAEQFLESPDSAFYQEGVRYFFGHPIPD
jgi:hypothetical protein